MQLLCPICKKEMPSWFRGCVHTYFYKGDECRLRCVCSEECKKQHEKRYEYEKYKNTMIYKIDDCHYVPYLGCDYYFTTVDDCKKRIDQPFLRPATPFFMYGLAQALKG